MIKIFMLLTSTLWLSMMLQSEEPLGLKMRNIFVKIKISVAKSDEPFRSEDSYDEFEHYYLENRSYVTFGIIADKNTIIMEDIGLRPSRFKSISIKTTGGKEFVAKLSAFCKDRNLCLLKVEGELVAPQFKGVDTTGKSPLLFTTIDFRNNDVPYLIHKDISSALKTVALFEEEKNVYPTENPDSQNHYFGLITNKKGEVLGLQSSFFYNVNGKSSFFIPKDLQPISISEMNGIKDELEKRIHKNIFFVQIHFRGNANADDYGDNLAEIKLLGILFNDKGDIFLPYDLSYEQVNKIEKIEIELPGKVLEAEFKGSFANFGGILLHSDALKSGEDLLQLDYKVKPEELLYEFSVMWISAEDYQIDFNTARLDYKVSSVDDRPAYEMSAYGKPSNCLVFNEFLKIPGFLSIYKNQDYIANQNSWASDDRFYLAFEDLQKDLSDPSAHFDKRSILMNKQESLTPVWLGVDVQELNKSLSEHFKISDKTKNGSLGVLVTKVYKNSPAEIMQIQILDVLLSVQYVDSDRVYEFLSVSNGYGGYSGFHDDLDYGGGGYNYSFFANRKNLVTDVLSKLEIGKKVRLKMLRQGQFKEVEFVLEKAPKDFTNADKYVDDDFGFQVKELTYEVIASLNKNSEMGGVIISTLTEGKPAALAHLGYFEIITHVDGEKVSDLKSFEKLIGSKKSNQAEFTFTVSYLGQNRLVKVDLKK